MAELVLSLVVNPSLLTRPLLDGEVAPRGVILQAEAAVSADQTSRKLPTLDFDVAEVELSAFVRAREDRIPVLALPLFTSGRRFLHRGIFWSARSGIRDLTDLPRRVAATPQYWMASSIWQRKFLGMAYRVDPRDLSWVTLQPEQLGTMQVPPSMLHRLESAGRSAEELARTGSVDIVLYPEGGPASRPRLIGRPPPAFVPSFADAAAAEREYFEQSGVFPILNVTVIRESLVREHPWLVESICQAYLEAKRLAQSREQPSDAPAPGPGETTNWMRALIGDDAWAYGIRANSKALNAFLAAARTQGLVSTRFELSELFAPGIPPELE